LRELLQRGLEKTAALFPEVRIGFGYVHRVARLLDNPGGLPGEQIKQRLRGMLRRLRAAARRAAARGQQGLAEGLRHFVKVSKSYEPGLFHCYDVAGLPRTNNDLEHLFGSHRYHERRASGRKVASPGLVVRGSVRLVASAVTRLREVTGEELAPKDLHEWRQLRQRLERRQESRRRQRRFRRAPNAYLRMLEEKMLQSGLLS
jgi:hypothetical protein